MKKLLLLSASILALALPARAQVETNMPPIPSFFSSVGSYLTSFNTNLTTFQAEKGSISAGMDYQNGLNISANLLIEYNAIGKISVESETRNASVAGTIVSQQIGAGLNFVIHDVKLTLYADGGYDFLDKKPFAEIGSRIKKALTEHTYIGLGIGARISKQPAPVLTFFTGFTF